MRAKSNRREFLHERFPGQVSVYTPPMLEKEGLSMFEYPSDEHRQLIERQALEIFTICSNAGMPLRNTLAAILITGMDWGINGSKQKGP